MGYEDKSIQFRGIMEENIPIEIERRFLVRSIPTNLGNGIHLRQWYVPSSFIEFNDNIVLNGIEFSLAIGNIWGQSVYNLPKQKDLSIRIRLDGKSAILCIKAPMKGISRYEYECELEDYSVLEKLLMDSTWPMVEKRRWRIIEEDNHIWDLDQFLGLNNGLWLTEIELSDENEQFINPKWIGNEVTEDRRFSSEQLSQSPYTEIEGYEKYTHENVNFDGFK